MTNKPEHDTCVCALNDQELALRDERERLAELVNDWMDEVNKHLGTDICTDGLYFDMPWFPGTPTCKLELAD
jgi:hypothetical protein